MVRIQNDSSVLGMRVKVQSIWSAFFFQQNVAQKSVVSLVHVFACRVERDNGIRVFVLCSILFTCKRHVGEALLFFSIVHLGFIPMQENFFLPSRGSWSFV